MKKIITIFFVGFMGSPAWSCASVFNNIQDCLAASKQYCSQNKCPKAPLLWCKKHLKNSDALSNNS